MLTSPRLSRLAALRRLPQRALLGLVHGYRLLLKPWIGNACRFEPTCSAYALQALSAHGAARGSVLTAARILRCHPWCAGGVDPVPADGRLFSRLGLACIRDDGTSSSASSCGSSPGSSSSSSTVPALPARHRDRP